MSLDNIGPNALTNIVGRVDTLSFQKYFLCTQIWGNLWLFQIADFEDLP